ncbi:hypothetical protein FQN60_004927 [Etheostoma spectabile]|uniref:Ig-like domain-containing protein n=1 Tax=Etheostoma spectabile TaxID=54343 RepID=A0A5J5DLH0_9PERO|nr:hypothetical protein FQN60_004927 [Etheostoma spectabile]
MYLIVSALYQPFAPGSCSSMDTNTSIIPVSQKPFHILPDFTASYCNLCAVACNCELSQGLQSLSERGPRGRPRSFTEGIWALWLCNYADSSGFHLAGSGQMVQMDSAKSGFVGSQVELRCIFVNSNPPVKISQVTWQKVLNGSKQNVAIANPALGVSVLPPFKERVTFKQAAVRHRTPSLEDTTIMFSELQLSDEAAYICEYTTFPAGNRENMVNLTVFARPMTRMTLTTPTIVARASKRKMTVATCVSANGKPPSVIKWDTRLKGEATFQETHNQNGTVTVRSNYVVVPSRETHKQKLTCIVTYRNERITDSVVLNVQYEPEVKIEDFDGNWFLNRQNVQLTCRADANPPVTIYQWKLRKDQHAVSGVRQRHCWRCCVLWRAQKAAARSLTHTEDRAAAWEPWIRPAHRGADISVFASETIAIQLSGQRRWCPRSSTKQRRQDREGNGRFREIGRKEEEEGEEM